MIDALMIPSTIGGLIAFLVAVVFIPYCLTGDEGRANEFGAMAWLVVLAFIVLVYPIGAIERLSLVTWLALIPAYFAIGALWFLYSWRKLILRKKAESRKNHADTMERRPPERRETYEAWQIGMSDRPQARHHAEQITSWILLWPWGMLWTVLKWPVRLAVHIGEWAHGIADRMVDRLWNA
jgi:hypothetical protein